MKNPMLQMLNRSGQQRPTVQSNPVQMLQQFQQFAKGLSPQQAQNIIQQKLNSGEISRVQFESAKQQAQTMASVLGIK